MSEENKKEITQEEVPDFIPLAGYLDDATVFAFVLSVAQDDLNRYRKWRKKEQNTININ